MQRIKLNEEIKAELIKDFENYLNKTKFTTPKVDYTIDLKPKETLKEKIKLIISPTAYTKMLLYVRDTATEIAWHGTVLRLQKGYYIDDVMLYPQILSQATVNTDQEKYQDWLISLDDETANRLRFQGHSHVNFSTSPSGTDLNYYESILQTLPDNDFYIFMIINKAGDMTLIIYDLEENIIYNTEDIDLYVMDLTEENDILSLIECEKEIFCEKPKYTPISQNYNTYNSMFLSEHDYNKTKTDSIFDYLDQKYVKTHTKGKKK